MQSKSITNAPVTFLSRMLRHLTGDQHLTTSIEWALEPHRYRIGIFTGEHSIYLLVDHDGAACEWPPPYEVLEHAITTFTATHPELLI